MLTFSGAITFKPFLMTDQLIAGIPGDFRPFACLEADGRLHGHDVALLEALAGRAGFSLQWIRTDWATLAAGLGHRYDVAAGGVTITPEREKLGWFLPAYAPFWKTGLVRKADLARFPNTSSLNRPDVRVIKNPGGTNEQWVDSHLSRAALTLDADNVAIPDRIARGEGDLMVTDVTEARHYAALDERLAVLPFALTPITMKGVWVAKGDAQGTPSCGGIGRRELFERLLGAWRTLAADGTLSRLAVQYGVNAATSSPT